MLQSGWSNHEELQPGPCPDPASGCCRLGGRTLRIPSRPTPKLAFKCVGSCCSPAQPSLASPKLHFLCEMVGSLYWPRLPQGRHLLVLVGAVAMLGRPQDPFQSCPHTKHHMYQWVLQPGLAHPQTWLLPVTSGCYRQSHRVPSGPIPGLPPDLALMSQGDSIS